MCKPATCSIAGSGALLQGLPSYPSPLTHLLTLGSACILALPFPPWIQCLVGSAAPGSVARCGRVCPYAEVTVAGLSLGVPRAALLLGLGLVLPQWKAQQWWEGWLGVVTLSPGIPGHDLSLVLSLCSGPRKDLVSHPIDSC